ncbi:MAG: hypothetical protein Q7S87_04910 [Agitococcus sp.]|nr:hypothetical protein [Agitococcus sp.]
MTALTQEEFLKNVAKHQMHILRNDGLYRHVRFKREGTMCMHFDLVTWPGYLAYSGDMGCFVFSRIEDMFEFFRADRKHGKDDGNLKINLGYWSEKLQAVDGNRNGGCAKEFSEDTFTRIIHEWRISWIKEYRDKLTKGQRRELWDFVQEQVIAKAEEGGHAAYSAAYEFEYTVNDLSFQFHDFWDHNCDEYTHRFIWCCYALAWGIKQYDFVVPSKEAA